ncbi:MAG: HDIG domain-containing protein, partial [bacterium]|nr:HDIG domain-containing protein [bacterium]
MTFKLRFLKNSTTAREKKKTSIFFLFIGLLMTLLLSYLLYLPQQKTIVDHELEVGEIAKEDIIVHENISVEDKEATGENRKLAIENTVPVYEYLAGKQSKTRELLTGWFNLVRESKKDYIKDKKQLTAIKEMMAREFGLDFSDSELKSTLESPFFRKIDLNQLLQFIDSLYNKRIVASLTGAGRSSDGTVKLVSKNREPETLKIDEVYDLKKAETAMNQFIREQDRTLSRRSAEFITSILMDFIDVNVSYSGNLTQEAQQRASAAVNPVTLDLKTDKVILRKGDEVTEEDKKILGLIANAERIREQRLPDFVLIFVILVVLGLFGNKFFKIWQTDGINKEKTFMVMSATLLVSAGVYRVSLFLLHLILKNMTIAVNYDMQSIYFAIPFGFGALVMAYTCNLQGAVIYSFINAVIGGMICDWDFRIVLFILLGNLAVSFGIEYYQRLKRSPIIKAAIFRMLPVGVLTVVVFNLTEADTSWTHISVDVVMIFIAAVVSPVLANFIIPLWESFFSLVTELKLIELANLNLPIFREMLEKAPGTYHHSQMVASLSEAAAQDLGISPLLQTTMALYHDIGKIDNPHFFTENHALYKNPHENLSPRESAKNIVSHIPDGLERAEKLKLPDMVASAIRQHHGTKVVRFFYDKAREMSSVDSDGFDDKVFRYQGEKPANIENGIIMLADQVEAASKSLASPTEEDIKNVIGKIIDSNIEENQFDDCEGLTFKAVNTIANSFHKKLSSIYHMRISYPAFDFTEKKDPAARGA